MSEPLRLDCTWVVTLQSWHFLYVDWNSEMAANSGLFF